MQAAPAGAGGASLDSDTTRRGAHGGLDPSAEVAFAIDPAALRLIRAGELLREAGGGDRRGERSPWLPGSY